MLGATVPAHTWFGALMSIVGLAILESSGSPPSVGVDPCFCWLVILLFVAFDDDRSGRTKHSSYINFPSTGLNKISLFSSTFCNIGFVFAHSQIGDLLNFLTVVFFGVHMLRTEHVWRNTNRKNLLPLLGYKVCLQHKYPQEM